MTQFVMFILCSVDQFLTVFKKELLGEKCVTNLGQTQDGLSVRSYGSVHVEIVILMSDGIRFPVYRCW